MAKLGQEDARRDGVYWLVEPLYGKRIHRLVQSTHHQGAQALAKTYRLALATLVTPVAWSVATMKTAIARGEFASYRPRSVRATLVRRVHWRRVLSEAYRDAERTYGCGYVGLLDKSARRGNRAPRVEAASKHLLESFLRTHYAVPPGQTCSCRVSSLP
jgi:hypothetical protein